MMAKDSFQRYLASKEWQQFKLYLKDEATEREIGFKVVNMIGDFNAVGKNRNSIIGARGGIAATGRRSLTQTKRFSHFFFSLFLSVMRDELFFFPLGCRTFDNPPSSTLLARVSMRRFIPHLYYPLLPLPPLPSSLRAAFVRLLPHALLTAPSQARWLPFLFQPRPPLKPNRTSL